MEILIPLFTQLAIVGVVILIVIALVYAILGLRSRIRQPGLALVLDALSKFALTAIYGAESLALDAMNTLDFKFESLDKKAIANAVYDVLPNTIYIAGRPVPISFVKTLVTRETWEAFVQREFGEADGFIHRQRDYLLKQLKDLEDRLDTGGSLIIPGAQG